MVGVMLDLLVILGTALAFLLLLALIRGVERL